MKKVLILEGNIRSLAMLKCLVLEVSRDVEVIALNRAADAYEYAVNRTIGLFIVDIVLDTGKAGDSSGLKFIDWLRKNKNYAFTPVVIVTALEDLKLYSFQELHCYSYMEKPFDPERVKKIVAECLEFPGIPVKQNILYLRKDGIIWTIDKDRIIYAQNQDRLIEIHIWKEDCLRMPYMTLKQLTEEINSPDIIQCSRSAIVNIRFIRNIDIPNGIIELKDHLGRLEIGLTYKKKMREFFKG